MQNSVVTIGKFLQDHLEWLQGLPRHIVLLTLAAVFGLTAAILYLAVFLLAPEPRFPYPSEKKYQTILPTGETSEPKDLPCWYDQWRAYRQLLVDQADAPDVQAPEVFVSVVVPAYNEEERLGGMLEEAVDFLQRQYGDAYGSEVERRRPSVSSKERTADGKTNGSSQVGSIREGGGKLPTRGWEILVVSDGSRDKTVETALKFARDHQLEQYPIARPGPWTSEPKSSTSSAGSDQSKAAAGKPAHGQQIPHGSIRVVTLAANRGKGGAVTHGMRHVRGRYIVFADADGASRFEDLEGLVKAAAQNADQCGRAVAIGSRAHLVGSEAVVKRSLLRNTLMRCFHLFIKILTPSKTSKIRDTQCGFKLFTRAALPDIIPYMHMEGWIFDVEMLMLSESAGIPMVEVPVGWKEVGGSKLNVVWDSLGMAWGLAILRLSWWLGVYQRW